MWFMETRWCRPVLLEKSSDPETTSQQENVSLWTHWNHAVFRGSQEKRYNCSVKCKYDVYLLSKYFMSQGIPVLSQNVCTSKNQLKVSVQFIEPLLLRWMNKWMMALGNIVNSIALKLQYVYIYIYIYILYSGAKMYLVSHQLCKFSHLKRWERPVIFIIGIPQLWETK